MCWQVTASTTKLNTRHLTVITCVCIQQAATGTWIWGTDLFCNQRIIISVIEGNGSEISHCAPSVKCLLNTKIYLLLFFTYSCVNHVTTIWCKMFETLGHLVISKFFIKNTAELLRFGQKQAPTHKKLSYSPWSSNISSNVQKPCKSLSLKPNHWYIVYMDSSSC